MGTFLGNRRIIIQVQNDLFGLHILEIVDVALGNHPVKRCAQLGVAQVQLSGVNGGLQRLDLCPGALDPVSTQKIEELIRELKTDYTIAMVTHSLPQARHLADYTGFLNTEESESGGLIGYLAEMNNTEALFEFPQHETTKGFVTGRFG